MERLQKVMASAGIGSRRACEELILEGLVEVNGRVVDELPVLVDPANDKIVVDGKRIRTEYKAYYLLNKPKKVLCTNYDPSDRTKAIDLMKGVRQRLFPVGRLDADSQGLLIMTNDGELTNLLTHPRYGITKTYVADISGALTSEEIDKLKRGVWLAEGKAHAERIKLLHRGPKNTLLEIDLREGRNRQIRRMLAQLGHPVRQLTRIKIGTITIKGLGPGKFRPLTMAEVNSLRLLVEQTKERAKPVKKGKKKPARKAVKRD
jgi:23S rRNA pseudouridine2605 synthase